MTADEQLDLWVEGKPAHNHDCWYDVVDKQGNVTERKKLKGGECCPDFSCCMSLLLAPREVRERFRDGDTDTRDGLLQGFLTMMITADGHTVSSREDTENVG